MRECVCVCVYMKIAENATPIEMNNQKHRNKQTNKKKTKNHIKDWLMDKEG